jgi:hypothetical protein
LNSTSSLVISVADPKHFETSQAIIDRKLEKIKEEQKKLKELQIKIEQKRQED